MSAYLTEHLSHMIALSHFSGLVIVDVTMEETLEALVRMAQSHQATDIHFVRDRNRLEVSLRQNERIVPVRQDIWQGDLFEYLKFRADMDLTKPRQPQSGTLVIHDVACRFAVLPNGGRDTGVLRLMNASRELSIDELSEDTEITGFFHEIARWRHGLVLFVGPTGAGKTTTLHAILREASLLYGHKCVSLEDPIEIPDDSYIQLQVDTKRGLDHERGIEELMRHDPDVICIGETRSPSVCRKMFTASLTGHFTLSTIHASDGKECIFRLLDMGIQADQIREQLSAVVAQRIYEMEKGGRICIHEIITKKAIEQILKTGQYPDDMQRLADKVWRAVEEGIVSELQAQGDFPR